MRLLVQLLLLASPLADRLRPVEQQRPPEASETGGAAGLGGGAGAVLAAGAARALVRRRRRSRELPGIVARAIYDHRRHGHAHPFTPEQQYRAIRDRAANLLRERNLPVPRDLLEQVRRFHP